MNPNIARRRHAKAAQARQQHENHDGSGHDQQGHEQVNVGHFERQLSMIGGTALALCGLMRGSISGLGLAAIGGALIWRGYSGHCEMYHMLGYSTNEGEESNAPAAEQYEPQFHGYETHAAGEV
jgi:Protein of unknown function (DUF2892)